MKALITRTALALAMASTAVVAMAPKPAAADEASTAAIVGGLAAIVGAILYDNSGHPYYVRDGHRNYVSNSDANAYRAWQRDDRNDRRSFNDQRNDDRRNGRDRQH